MARPNKAAAPSMDMEAEDIGAEVEAAQRAEAEAQRRAEAAAASERLRVQQEAAAKQAAADRRAADVKRRREVNRAAATALVTTAGLTEEQAMKVVGAVFLGDIPGVRISY